MAFLAEKRKEELVVIYHKLVWDCSDPAYMSHDKLVYRMRDWCRNTQTAACNQLLLSSAKGMLLLSYSGKGCWVD